MKKKKAFAVWLTHVWKQSFCFREAVKFKTFSSACSNSFVEDALGKHPGGGGCYSSQQDSVKF